MSDPTDCKNCDHTKKAHTLGQGPLITSPFGWRCKECKCARYEPKGKDEAPK